MAILIAVIAGVPLFFTGFWGIFYNKFMDDSWFESKIPWACMIISVILLVIPFIF